MTMLWSPPAEMPMVVVATVVVTVVVAATPTAPKPANCNASLILRRSLANHRPSQQRGGLLQMSLWSARRRAKQEPGDAACENATI
eukprot:CAMPEP_0178431152 /NCGR_PEP_ID=MMETSP0689_2-20121128/31690_1 /TAXON_ID=160604 /ORGANISM="Amphidinium massartii, Strain CS-259" /LENGTH=85 /DNA_ID=CAMNT_0020053035 /DNA_START=816 /DNA_END=1073 /DNA_ORIENTATION=-